MQLVDVDVRNFVFTHHEAMYIRVFAFDRLIQTPQLSFTVTDEELGQEAD